MRLLSIDWDFFFPVVEHPSQDTYRTDWMLYDWGRREDQFFINGAIWTVRAAGFYRADRELPGLSGEQEAFWPRVTFAEHCPVFVAESHAEAAMPEVLRGVTEIVSFDAHHDCGYESEPAEQIVREQRVVCENWLLYAAMIGCKATVVYPRWRQYAMKVEPWSATVSSLGIRRRVDSGQKVKGAFDRVFICRSGAWTPPWLDNDLGDFVSKRHWGVMQQSLTNMPRQWSDSAARSLAANEQAIMGGYAMGSITASQFAKGEASTPVTNKRVKAKARKQKG